MAEIVQWELPEEIYTQDRVRILEIEAAWSTLRVITIEGRNPKGKDYVVWGAKDNNFSGITENIFKESRSTFLMPDIYDKEQVTGEATESIPGTIYSRALEEMAHQGVIRNNVNYVGFQDGAKMAIMTAIRSRELERPSGKSNLSGLILFDGNLVDIEYGKNLLDKVKGFLTEDDRPTSLNDNSEGGIIDKWWKRLGNLPALLVITKRLNYSTNQISYLREISRWIDIYLLPEHTAELGEMVQKGCFEAILKKLGNRANKHQ